jgi:hypothetical protein
MFRGQGVRLGCRSVSLIEHRQSQSGQALIEYVLLLSIVVTIAIASIDRFTGLFDQLTARYGGKVEQQIRTGSAPPTIWNR